MKAIIIDNKPCCSECEGNPILGNGTGEYSLVSHEGKNYVKFQRFCNGSCGKKYEYFSEITLEGTIRHSFDNDIKEVHDEENME